MDTSFLALQLRVNGEQQGYLLLLHRTNWATVLHRERSMSVGTVERACNLQSQQLVVGIQRKVERVISFDVLVLRE